MDYHEREERIARLDAVEHLMTGMERRLLDALRRNDSSVAKLRSWERHALPLREFILHRRASFSDLRLDMDRALRYLENTYSYQLATA